jgi:hypothetical protein
MGRTRLHVGEDVVYVGLGLLLAGCSLAPSWLKCTKSRPSYFQHFIMELLALTVLIVALVISLVLLRKRNGIASTKRAK